MAASFQSLGSSLHLNMLDKNQGDNANVEIEYVAVEGNFASLSCEHTGGCEIAEQRRLIW
ncbi:hypothetical protein PCAR4_570092 [Paraburkholderia caribensis]|nr:hypothetical protein PCAR4_570092 [Paraburkholderia caribensis]